MTDFFRHPLVDWLQQGTRGGRLLQALKTAGRFAVCERDQVQLYTRESADGGQVLFVFNPSPYVIAHETITLAIAASSVVDIAVPGAFPVPAKTTSNGTTFPVTLAPGQLAAYRIQ